MAYVLGKGYIIVIGAAGAQEVEIDKARLIVKLKLYVRIDS